MTFVQILQNHATARLAVGAGTKILHCRNFHVQFEKARKPVLLSTLRLSRSRVAPKISAKSAPASDVNSISEEAKTPLVAEGADEGNSVVVGEERLPNSHIRLTVTVPPAFVRRTYERALKKLRAETDIPGFRKGKKAPDRVIINAAGGPEVANGKCVELILSDVLPVALQKYRDTAIDESERIEEEFDVLIKAFDLDSSFIFHVGLDVQPTHSWKAPYRDLKVEVTSLGGPEEDTATVDAKILQLRKNRGTMKVVPGRPLQIGDVAIVDFKTVRADTGENIVGSQRKGMQLDTGLGDRAIGLTGIVEGMVGMKIGEERSITTTVGDTWWEPDSLRGVELHAEFKLKELFEWELPALTDDLVEAAFPGVGGVDALRAALNESTALQREEDQKEQVHEALIRAVADCVDADIPDSAIRQLAENEYQAKLHEIQLKEKLSFEQVNQLATQELLSNYVESRREKLLTLQKATLGIGDIFQQEGMELPEHEVRKEMEDAVSDFEQNDQEYDKDRLREQVEEVLKAQKVLEWLETNVDIVLK